MSERIRRAYTIVERLNARSRSIVEREADRVVFDEREHEAGRERKMKLMVASRAIGTLAAVACLSCCRDPSCSGSKPPAPNDDDPAFTLTPAEQKDACEAAGRKLAELKCKQARTDFGVFCVNALEGKIPIRPLCLASMSDCSEIDGRCRTGTGASTDGGTP